MDDVICPSKLFCLSARDFGRHLSTKGRRTGIDISGEQEGGRELVRGRAPPAGVQEPSADSVSRSSIPGELRGPRGLVRCSVFTASQCLDVSTDGASSVPRIFAPVLQTYGRARNCVCCVDYVTVSRTTLDFPRARLYLQFYTVLFIKIIYYPKLISLS